MVNGFARTDAPWGTTSSDVIGSPLIKIIGSAGNRWRKTRSRSKPSTSGIRISDSTISIDRSSSTSSASRAENAAIAECPESSSSCAMARAESRLSSTTSTVASNSSRAFDARRDRSHVICDAKCAGCLIIRLGATLDVQVLLHRNQRLKERAQQRLGVGNVRVQGAQALDAPSLRRNRPLRVDHVLLGETQVLRADAPCRARPNSACLKIKNRAYSRRGVFEYDG